MAADRIATVNELLVETMKAHGAYEATELEGVYDTDWPIWYARYAVGHGIGDLLDHDVTSDRLAQFLASGNVEYEQIEPGSREPWAAYTARRIVGEL